ncbi:MFS transporter [Acinetobacter ursingii]|uniref:MFS transporter n=1 Tax=Acinetobacter ursingii TaxID=108980 RepID=UPI003AF8E9F2
MLAPRLKAVFKLADQDKPSFFSVLLIGIAQIIVWGGSFFLLAVMARPIMSEMGWGRELVYGALSLSILVSAFALPYIGRLISRHGGKEILAMSGIITALGLFILAFSYHLAFFFLAWIVIGLGMAIGLYDTLFAVLGNLFGLNAKVAIVSVTLISGFCTTIVWPVQAYAVSLFGWRATCVFGAVLMIIVIWPIYHYALPKPKKIAESSAPQQKNKTNSMSLPKSTYHLISIIFMITSIIMTVMTVQLIDILQENGLALASAIAISALIGPSQVASRMLDLVIKFDHPIKSLLVSVVLVVVGIILLCISPKYAALAMIIYGAGNGLRSIVRGTLPLTLVKKEEYAYLMGKLARPSLIAQAMTPLIAGYMIDAFGANTVLYSIALLALLNVIFSMILMKEIRQGKVMTQS